jgi:hypothetical protein
MTLLKKMNRPSALRTGVARETTRTITRPLVQVRSAAVRNEAEIGRLIDEIGAWLVFGSISLLGWIAAAAAFGLV